MLVHAAHRGIHTHHAPVDPTFRVRVGLDSPQDSLPRAVRRPPAVTVVDRLPLPEPRGQCGDPSTGPASQALWQVRLQSSPLAFRYVAPSHSEPNDPLKNPSRDPSDTPWAAGEPAVLDQDLLGGNHRGERPQPTSILGVVGTGTQPAGDALDGVQEPIAVRTADRRGYRGGFLPAGCGTSAVVGAGVRRDLQAPAHLRPAVRRRHHPAPQRRDVGGGRVNGGLGACWDAGG